MNIEKELKGIFKELTPENQVNLLTNARLAQSVERAIKKAVYAGLERPVHPQREPAAEGSC